ncbi:hypothetical protein I316_00251 [Kwoniella heveanensis BCC8398]|uniref:Uncharacterized protein n=1 Tax=Kwoniella heveanensis BCC8398 TaxID=1296120 RepID=A0A1B9H437_9TREE|nr:hypothetical protein I316_00251 [Kwoniella heveanensis BCC8398]
MIFRAFNWLLPLLLASSTMAAIFGSSDDSSSSSSSSSLSSSSSSSSSSFKSSPSSENGTAVNSPEVDFLLTLQSASISSMSCLITLVNLTTSPVGDCLGLTDLSNLISRPATNVSFSEQLDDYLGTVCSLNCAQEDLDEARGMLGQSCDEQNGLVQALDKVMERYSSSYKTLACQVSFNATTDLCLPSTLNTSDAANNNGFFNSLVTGTNLDQYADSVFKSAKCTGCMHEMFKAAQYTTPMIRGQELTDAFGNHLMYDCASAPEGEGINWGDTMDQQIPSALQVSQNTNPYGSSRKSGAVAGPDRGSNWTSILTSTVLIAWGTMVAVRV